jgi:hypothetical protein
MFNGMRKTQSAIGAGLLLIALLISGCGGGGNTPSYSASGRVIDKNGDAMSGATVLFNGIAGATSDALGQWNKANLTGNVTVTVQKEGYIFFRTASDGNGFIANNPAGPGSQTDIVFKGYSEDDNFTAQGTIVNGGPDIGGGPVNGAGLADVALYYEYPVGMPHTVTTDSNGNWIIPEKLVGAVVVTPKKSGWIFCPATFTLTSDNNRPKGAGTTKYYSGQDVLTMASSSANPCLNGPAPVTITATATIAGDTIEIADAMYLCAKFVALYSPNQIKLGVVPSQVPYLKIAAPISYGGQTGSIGGSVMFPGFISNCQTIAAGLESSLMVPSSMSFNWSAGSIAPGTPTDIRNLECVSILGRLVNYIKTYPDQGLPNYAGVRTVTNNSWPQ